MANPYFRFKKFTIFHDQSAMKVTTDACLFGAWMAVEVKREMHSPREEQSEKNPSVSTSPDEKKKEHASGKELTEEEGAATMLDIGTGTGLLSMMIAQKNEVSIDAVEIDGAAARQAAENVAASPFADRIRIFKANILRFYPEKKYRFIISNPPFYADDLRSDDAEKNLAHHSESLKLPELFSAVKEHLHPGGSFFLLMPFKREKEVEKLFQQFGFFFREKVTVKQSVKHGPFRIMYCLKNEETKPAFSEVSIWDEERNYTGRFVELLRDYYLYL